MNLFSRATLSICSLLGLSVVVGFGCAHDNNGQKTSSENTAGIQTAGVNSKARFARVAKIDFAKGTYALTSTEKTEISKLVKTARENGKIDEIKILAWADRDTVGGRKATEAERNLAANRVKAVRAFIRENLDWKDIDTHNMAEQPSALDRIFKTDDFELKTGIYDEDGVAFSPAPSPQKVVVFIEMDEDRD